MDTAVSSPTRAGMILQQDRQPLLGPVGQGAVDIHPPPHAVDGHPGQQHGDHQRTEIHTPAPSHGGQELGRQQRPRATDRTEASHTAGRMSKGGLEPAGGADGGDGGGQQLDGSGVEHHQQAQLVAGGAVAAAGHPPGRLDPQGRGGVAQPQQVGRHVGGDVPPAFVHPGWPGAAVAAEWAGRPGPVRRRGRRRS